MSRVRSASLAALVLSAFAVASFADALPAAAANKQPTITVLVTNDDGVSAPGIDALVEALRTTKNTKVVVVAPATNQTGVGGSTTPGTLVTSPAATASGYQATAVKGTPADTITAALDQLGLKPNVVMSGLNSGQNLGTGVEVSGTVGAARAAARRGIPAIALSQGVNGTPQFSAGAKVAVDWLAKHRSALAKKPKGALTTIDNVNIPNCPSGKPRGVKQVQTAPNVDNSTAPVDCSSTTKPKTDIEAFLAGWAAEATVPATPSAS